MKIIYAALLLVSLQSARIVYAQGCSDAGICTIHSIKNNTETYTSAGAMSNNIKIGFGYGKGEKALNNYTWQLEYNRRLTEKLSVTGKINYAAINGELANTSGPGDLFLSVTNIVGMKMDVGE